jgi:hypothetical protein
VFFRYQAFAKITIYNISEIRLFVKLSTIWHHAESQCLSVSVVFHAGKKSKINSIFIYKYRSIFWGPFVPFLTETLRY